MKQAFPEDLLKLQNWSKIISQTSRCGLGISAPNVLTTSLQSFPELFQLGLASQENPLLYPFDENHATANHENAVRNLK
jgi:[NiFe] hydrogenase diaphorase moiety large subunit